MPRGPYQKTAVTIIHDAMRDMKMDEREIAEFFGVSRGAVVGWLNVGTCPAWVEPAIQGLRSVAGETKPSDEVLLIRAEPSLAATIKGVLDAMNVSYSAM